MGSNRAQDFCATSSPSLHRLHSEFHLVHHRLQLVEAHFTFWRMCCICMCILHPSCLPSELSQLLLIIIDDIPDTRLCIHRNETALLRLKYPDNISTVLKPTAADHHCNKLMPTSLEQTPCVCVVNRPVVSVCLFGNCSCNRDKEKKTQS